MPALSWLNWSMCLWQDAFFFWLLGIPQMYPTKAETQLKKCLILEGSGMVPSRAAGENVRALWLPRVRCGKKGGSMWLPFCASWILRQSFSSLAGKRPLTDWGMKTYFSRPESLPELRRLREHIKWHIWCGRIAEVLKWQTLWTWNLRESHGISVKAVRKTDLVNRLVETSRTRSFVAQERCRLLAPWLPPSCKQKSNPKKSQRDAPEIHGGPDFSEAASRWSFLILSHFGKVGGNIFRWKVLSAFLLREVCFSAAFWTWDSQVMRWPTKIFVEVQRLISLMSQKNIWKDWIQKFLFWLNASKKVFALLGAELL